jgi:dynein heavy chain
MEISYVIRIVMTLNVLVGILRPLVQSNKTLTETDYEKVIVYAITWAIGGVFEAQDR